jgi:hypothetical protein
MALVNKYLSAIEGCLFHAGTVIVAGFNMKEKPIMHVLPWCSITFTSFAKWWVK